MKLQKNKITRIHFREVRLAIIHRKNNHVQQNSFRDTRPSLKTQLVWLLDRMVGYFVCFEFMKVQKSESCTRGDIVITTFLHTSKYMLLMLVDCAEITSFKKSNQCGFYHMPNEVMNNNNHTFCENTQTTCSFRQFEIHPGMSLSLIPTNPPRGMKGNSEKPDIVGVTTPSAITIEVPARTNIRSNFFSLCEVSRRSFTFNDLSSSADGTLSLKLDIRESDGN